jgi:signal transduction histidine kinase/DNA-binding response OmpR family regulator
VSDELVGRRIPVSNANDADFLASGGALGALIRTFDWSKTPLGPPEKWSASLRMMVSFLLANRFPLLLWWGPHYIQIYNDAYRPVLGTKHPQHSLGQPASECWREIWDVIGPLIDTPYQGGPATWMEDIELEINRHGYLEESHFTIAYSPVPDETAPRGIGGVLATVHEITEKVIGQRRVSILSELGARATEGKSADQACAVALDTLRNHSKDVPFAFMYLLEGDGIRLRRICEFGLPTESIGPAEMSLESAEATAPWPLAQAIRGERAQILDRVDPTSTWIKPGNNATAQAVVLPIKSNLIHHPAGALVIGVSPRIALDSQYLAFCELLSSQVATAVANARAYESERRRAEALAEIDRAKTVFFSNVSHEFRTPLTLMLGPVEEALDNPETPLPVRTQLELAHRNSLRLLKLVNTLLDFSRIEAGRVQASYEPTDLSALTGDLASTFRSAIEAAGLHLVVDTTALDAPVYVDREMWEKIVLNLLSNAFKFTLRGTVAIRLRREGSDAVLQVEDTGVGVAQHELPRLFERFYRVEGTAGRTQEGSGIGLALVQELVKLHGGTIGATSDFGTGTSFRVTVPLGTAHLPSERIKAPRSLSSTAVTAQAFVQEALRWIPTNLSDTASPTPTLMEGPTKPSGRHYAKTIGARILLADDNADMRMYVHDLLSPTYAVQTVADGQQALEAARHQRPDLILSDIMMPNMDGLQLLKALRADEALRDIPVILLSARAGEESRVEGLDSGADDYLVKPFSARELTARVGALLELTRMRRENEERFRAFMSATSDVIYRMSADWSEMRSLQGRNSVADTEDPSRTWLDKYIPGEDQPHVMAAVHEAIRNKDVFQLEHRVRRADGTLGWTFSRAIALKDADGNIVEWFGAASDVTERKRAEQQLREGEEALRQAHAELQARTVDLARFNQAAVRRELRMIELKEEVNQLRQQLGESCRYRLEADEELDHLAPTTASEGDALVPLESILRTQQLHARSGRPPDYHAENQAFAALVQALADSPRTILQTLAEKTLQALRAGSAGLSLLTQDGERFYWAAIAGDWSPHLGGSTPRGFGPCGDVLDRNTPLLFTHWEHRYPYLSEATPLAEEGLLTPFYVGGKAIGTIWAIAHDSERKFDVEDLRLLQSLARFASVAYQAVEFLGALDQRRAALNLLEDAVQAQRFAEDSNRKLRESEEALREADRRKTEFLALLGHELRNPLSPISTASELLSRTLSEQEQAHVAIDMIKRQAAQLTRLVDDLLDVGRITQGRIELQRQPLDLATVIAQALETVEPQLRQRQHEVCVVGRYERLYVNGDFARLVQCVVNLLTNAAKYTQPRGRIRVETRPEDSNVVIEVSDTGAGISSELLPQIFELFVQGDRTLDRAEGGLGVGLSVVKRLIEMHNGNVSARSEGPGRGSTFEIRLPRVAAPAPASEDAPTVESIPRRVLIVDDNADAADSLAMLLSLAGHETEVAHNAHEALECLDSFRPDVALLDIGLPGMNGYELARCLRARRPRDMRLVALTGYGQAEDRQHAQAAGFDAHLVKPADLSALERTLA